MGDIGVPRIQNFTAQVCLESYLAVLPKNNHSVSDVPIKILLLVMAMISSMFGT